MTIQEMGQVMDILTVAYPAYYKKSTEDERFMACQLWAQMFADDVPAIVVAAVKAFISTDDKGFPPSIGQIKNQIASITGGEQKSALEAWAEVKKTLGYANKDLGKGAVKGFNSLEPVIQRIVGSPSQLREWAAIEDPKVIDGVIASNFRESYNACEKHFRESLCLPSAVSGLINELSAAKSLGAEPKPEEQKALPVSVEAIVNEVKEIVKGPDVLPKVDYKPLSQEDFEKRKQDILRQIAEG